MKDFKYTTQDLWERKLFFLQLCHEIGNESNWHYDKINHVFDCLGQLPFDDKHDLERADLYQKLEELREKSRTIKQKQEVFWSEMRNIDIIFAHLKWQETYLKEERETAKKLVEKELIKLTQNMSFIDKLKFVLK